MPLAHSAWRRLSAEGGAGGRGAEQPGARGASLRSKPRSPRRKSPARVTVNRHGSISINMSRSASSPVACAPPAAGPPTPAAPTMSALEPHDALMGDSARALALARKAVRSGVSDVHGGQRSVEAQMGARVRAQRLSPTRAGIPPASERSTASEPVPHGAEVYCERVRVDITSVLGAIRGIVDSTRWSPSASHPTTHAELLSDLMAAVLRFKRECERGARAARDAREPREHSSTIAQQLEQHDGDIALLQAKAALDVGIALDAQRAEFEGTFAAELSEARGRAATLRTENELVRSTLHEQTELVASLQHAARAAAREGERDEGRRAAQQHDGFERLARLEFEQRATREAALVSELCAAQLAAQQERDARDARAAHDKARAVPQPAEPPAQRNAPIVRDAGTSPMSSLSESVDRAAAARSRSAAVAAAVDSEKRRGDVALSKAQARSAAALARTKAHSVAALANAKELWSEQRVGAIESEVEAMRSRVETRMSSAAESDRLRAEARIRRECSTLVTRAQDTFEEETASVLAQHRESLQEAQSARAKARALEDELENVRAARRDAEVALAAALEDASAAAEVTASEVHERATLDAAKRVQAVTRRLGDAHAEELDGALADGKALRLENARLQRELKELEATRHETFEQALLLESQRLEEESAEKLEEQRRLFEVKFDEALLAHITTFDTMMGGGGQQEAAFVEAWGPRFPDSRSGGRASAGDDRALPSQWQGSAGLGRTGATAAGLELPTYDVVHESGVQRVHDQRASAADTALPDDAGGVAALYSQQRLQNAQQQEQQQQQQPRVHVSRRGSIDINTCGPIRFPFHGAGGRPAHAVGHSAGYAAPASPDFEEPLQASQYATARQIFDARTQAGVAPLAYSSLR